MDVRNCVRCNKIFNYVGGVPICPNCRKNLEEKFKEVKLFIRKNSASGITEVAEKCDIDVKQIRQWIREERLSFSEDSAIGIDCEMCGKTIRTGRFCDTCKAALTNNLTSAYHKEPEKVEDKKETSSKMRFLNKDNIK